MFFFLFFSHFRFPSSKGGTKIEQNLSQVWYMSTPSCEKSPGGNGCPQECSVSCYNSYERRRRGGDTRRYLKWGFDSVFHISTLPFHYTRFGCYLKSQTQQWTRIIAKQKNRGPRFLSTHVLCRLCPGFLLFIFLPPPFPFPGSLPYNSHERRTDWATYCSLLPLRFADEIGRGGRTFGKGRVTQFDRFLYPVFLYT